MAEPTLETDPGTSTPPRPADPFAGLAGLQSLLSGAGQIYQNVTAPIANAPVIGGLLSGLGQTTTAVAGLPAKAFGDQAVQDAYDANRLTNEGGPAGVFDVPATVRGLAAAEQVRQSQLAGLAGDQALSAGDRAKAGLGAGLYGTIPYILPIPGAAEVGGLAKSPFRGPLAHVADVIDRGEVAAPVLEDGVNLGDALKAAQQAKQARMERVAGKLMQANEMSPEEAVRSGALPSATDTRALLDHLSVNFPHRASEFSAALQPLIDAHNMATYESGLAKVAEKQVAQSAREVEAAQAAVDRIGKQKADLLESAKDNISNLAKAHDQNLVRIGLDEGNAQIRSDLQAAARLDAADAAARAKVAAAQQTLEELRSGTPVSDVTLGDIGRRTRTVTEISPGDANRLASTDNLTAPSEHIQALKEATGLPVAKMEPALVNDLADAYVRNPEAFRTQKVAPFADQIRQSARYFGMSTEDMTAAVRRRGLTPDEAAAFSRAINARVVSLGREYRTLIETRAPQSVIDAAYAKWIQFAGTVGGANSAAGRTLGSLRQALPNAMREAVRVREQVIPILRRGTEDAHSQLAAAAADLERASKDAEAARTVARQTVDAHEKALAERFAAKREAEVQRYAVKVQAARELFNDKMTRLSEAEARAKSLAEDAQARAVQKATNGGLSPDKLKILAAIDPDNARAIALAVRDLAKKTPAEMFATAVMNSTYSGPLGLARSFIGALSGTGEFLGLRGLSIAEASALRGVARLFGKELGTPFTGHELPALFHGAAMGLARVPDEFVQVEKNGSSLFIEDGRVGRGTAFKNPVAAAIFESSLRTHGAFHEMRSVITKLAETEMLVAHYAAKISKGDPAAFVRAQDEIRANPPAELVKQLNLVVAREKFLGTTPRAVEDALKALAINIPLGKLGTLPAGRILFPALRFGYGMMGKTAEFLGGDIVRAPYLAAKAVTASEEALAHDYAREAFVAGNRAAISAGLWLKAYDLFQSGDLIGTDPDGRGRDQTINLGGNRVSLKWLGPIGAALGMQAATFDAVHQDKFKKNGDEQSALLAGLVGMAKAVENATFIGTLASIGTLVEGGLSGSTAGRLLGDAAARVAIPDAALLADIAKAMDTYQRVPSKELGQAIWDRIAAHVPVWEQTLLPKRDGVGDPLPITPQGPARYNPAASVEQPQDPALAESYRLAARVPGFSALKAPPATIGTGPNMVKLSDAEYDRYQVLIGTARKEGLNALLALPDYQQATAAEQARLFRTADGAAVRIGKQQFALEQISAASTDDQVVRAIHSGALAGNLYDDGLALDKIDRTGKLTPTVIAMLDAERTQPDPSKPDYQLSVAELVRGARLTDAWKQAPAFNYGTPGDWAAAERARAQLMKLQKEFPPTKDGSVTVTNPKVDDFYYQAANGLLSLFYTKSGSRKTNLISQERKVIEQDPLFAKHFLSTALATGR
jgi:hypothetical protein